MRHDNPLSPSGLPSVGRVLLQTEIASAQGDVVLDLPATPYTRFEVEIDNWSPSSDQVAPVLQFGIGGSIQSGASDYQLNVGVAKSNGTESFDFDEANINIRMTRNDNTYKAGNKPGESLSYTVTVVPGSGEFDLPVVWFDGSGLNDEGRMMGIRGHGVYRGTTSGVFGRADQIRFAFDANTISAGTFRLYGTE